MGQTLQDYSERIGDGDLVSIIDGSVDQFMEDIRSSRGGWESMKDWIEENWPGRVVGRSGFSFRIATTSYCLWRCWLWTKRRGYWIF